MELDELKNLARSKVVELCGPPNGNKYWHGRSITDSIDACNSIEALVSILTTTAVMYKRNYAVMKAHAEGRKKEELHAVIEVSDGKPTVVAVTNEPSKFGVRADNKEVMSVKVPYIPY